MGIIILPFWLAALWITIFAIMKTVRLIRNNEINFKEIFFGLIISGSIFHLICLSYLNEGSAWGLSPAFRIPVFMILVPFGFYALIDMSSNKFLKYFATLMLISAGIAGILCIIFNNVFFELLDILGVEKYY